LPAHLAAHTNSVPFADHVPDDVSFRDHAALHDNAITPHTDNIAEYAELSKCSQGHLWRNSNAEEIGRLARGYTDIKGTNTMFFKADSFTKHHPAAHHRAIRSTYLYSPADPAKNYFDCLDDDGNDGHSLSSSPLGSLDPAGEGVLESQDPEVEQHSSSTDGPMTKGPAMTEPTDKTRQALLAKTEPTDRHD
jgi:hypothetical protein